jgi:hypothetical protein
LIVYLLVGHIEQICRLREQKQRTSAENSGERQRATDSKVDRKRQRDTKTRVEQSSCSLLQRHHIFLVMRAIACDRFIYCIRVVVENTEPDLYYIVDDHSY